MRLAGLAMMLIAIAACGSPAQGSSQRDRAVAAWHDVTQCFREHGFNAPDAQIDDHGNATFPDNTPRVPDDVIAACQSVLDKLPGQESGSGPSADLIARRRQFAACMREHGVPAWPDPDAEGRFPNTPELAAEGKSTALVAARDACQHFLSGRAVNGG